MMIDTVIKVGSTTLKAQASEIPNGPVGSCVGRLTLELESFAEGGELRVVLNLQSFGPDELTSAALSRLFRSLNRGVQIRYGTPGPPVLDSSPKTLKRPKKATRLPR